MIRSIWIKGYRNLSETRLSFLESSPVVIYGNNNQGKSNFLESLYFLSHASSPLKLPLSSLIGSKESMSFLGAEFLCFDQISRRLYHSLERPSKKRVELEGKPIRPTLLRSMGVWTEYLSADAIRLFQDSPEGRRGFMDRFCSVLDPLYAELLSRYEKALKQKHSALKLNLSLEEVRIWNRQLVLLSPQIVQFRLSFLSLIESSFWIVFSHVFPEFVSSFSIRYSVTRLDCDVLDLSLYASLLERQFELDFEKEKLLGYSLSGPHRDDLLMFVNDLELTALYSRGMNRIFALFLYLCAYDVLSQSFSHYPVLLLDDALAEVDLENKSKILSYLSSKTQVFYTTVLPSDSELFRSPVLYQMKSGALLNG